MNCYFCLFCFNHNFFKKTFSLCSITESRNLDWSISNSDSLDVFKKSILSFIEPYAKSNYNCSSYIGLKYLTRLCFDLNHLSDHKFKQSFTRLTESYCSCGFDIDSTYPYLLHCPNFENQRKTYLDSYLRLMWTYRVRMIRYCQDFSLWWSLII